MADVSSARGLDQHDPQHLRMLLFGGYSGAQKRPYPGLAQEVQTRITEIYRVPRPAGHSTGSIIGRSSGGAGEGDTDPLQLRDFLAAWLSETGNLPDRVIESDLHALVSRANGRATRMLKRHHVSTAARAKCLELATFYIKWLKRSCEHVHRDKLHDGGWRCLDCGKVVTDELPPHPFNEGVGR